MWTILGVIAVAFLLISIFATTKHNSDVRNTNIDNGGLRNSYPNFKNYLEDNMTFDADTGRYFSYSKSVKTSSNDGKLFIGIKLNIKNEPILFTKFRNEYRVEFHGLDISGVNFNDNDSIDQCIQISLKKLQKDGVFDYSI